MSQQHPLPARVSEIFDPAVWREVEGTLAELPSERPDATEMAEHPGDELRRRRVAKKAGRPASFRPFEYPIPARGVGYCGVRCRTWRERPVAASTGAEGASLPATSQAKWTVQVKQLWSACV